MRLLSRESRLLPWVSAFTLVSGQASHGQQPDQLARDACQPPPGYEALSQLNDLRFLVIGELHGTEQTPALFGELVCALASSGMRTLVGLELMVWSESAINTYLRSDGTEADRTTALTDSRWLDPVNIEFPDGRLSNAMWELVERLRFLRDAGHEVAVTTFRGYMLEGEQSLTPFEARMAETLLEAEVDGDYDLAVVLTGSVHARTSRRTENGLLPFIPMAANLPEESTIRLNAVTGSGEAWNCRGSECGVYEREGTPEGATVRFELDDGLSREFDGIFAVGNITASPPLTSAAP